MSDMLTPEQIEAMFSAGNAGIDPQGGYLQHDLADVAPLTPEESDILGEVGNMSMGASATTMYSLLGRKVNITTPKVSIYDDVVQMLGEYNIPFIVVEVTYTQGLSGRNLLLLKSSDAAMITDIMLGGDGNIDPDTVELTELHLSAISEVMNQMVASGATSISQVLSMPVNISPPTATLVDLAISNNTIWANEPEKVIKISFNMEIEGLLKSELMQVMPYSFGKELVDTMLRTQQEAAAAPAIIKPKAPPPPPAQMADPVPVMPPANPAPLAHPVQPIPAAYVPQEAPAYVPPVQQSKPVNVQPVQYPTFDAPEPMRPGMPDNLDMIIDVPLQVSVELGKVRRSIKEVLDFNVGSVIVLDKLAGELVEVMVNGKLIARGEVVVIEENYGVRITEIIAPNKRL